MKGAALLVGMVLFALVASPAAAFWPWEPTDPIEDFGALVIGALVGLIAVAFVLVGLWLFAAQGRVWSGLLLMAIGFGLLWYVSKTL